MTKKNNLTKQYLRCLKACFPICGKQERKYLKKMESHLNEYIDFHPDATYESLVSEFGSPTAVVSEYFSNLEEEYLLRKLTVGHRIRLLISIFITLVVFYFLWIFLLAY